MTPKHSATPFDSFNARNISPKLVAETFIPPNQFKELVNRSHSLLIGPRGSGKTTLLKMLHPSALDNWKHSEAYKYRQLIDYTGIFIPSDVMWSAQVGSLGSESLTPTSKSKLAIAAFTTSVLDAFVDSVLYRINTDNNGYKKVSFDKADEEYLAKELANTGKLEPTYFSMRALKFALSDRRNQIHEIASKASFLDSENQDLFIADNEFVHIDYLSTLQKGIEVFNFLAKEEDARWALLFDELEIAPDEVLNHLLQSLRSTNEKLIFKLSISPYHKEISALDQSFSAMEGQDYRAIRLWFSNKYESFAFSKQLLTSLLEHRLGENTDYIKLFGHAEFEYESEPEDLSLDSEELSSTDKYKPGSREQKKFKTLYQQDSSFRRYIDSHNLNLDAIHKLPNQKRAQFIRKVAPIVHSRLEFRKETDDSASSRTRKNPLAYTGAEAILTITEGNPRWLIGLVNSLLINLPKTKRVSKNTQATEIRKAANRFRAMLKTIPCDSSIYQIRNRGVLSLLDDIGNYFYKNIVLDDFRPSPIGSFTVDSFTDPKLLDAIGRAVNAGALVYIPDNESSVIGSLKGKRFRLSYLLASYHKLPMNLLASQSLSKILTKKNDVTNDGTQLDLGYSTDDG
jgi:hypothetical protein